MSFSMSPHSLSPQYILLFLPPMTFSLMMILHTPHIKSPLLFPSVQSQSAQPLQAQTSSHSPPHVAQSLPLSPNLEMQPTQISLSQPAQHTAHQPSPTLSTPSSPPHMASPLQAPSTSSPTSPHVAPSTQPTRSQQSTHSMVTRSQHGIFKPKRPLNLHTSVTPSPIPRNPKAALSDPN